MRGSKIDPKYNALIVTTPRKRTRICRNSHTISNHTRLLVTEQGPIYPLFWKKCHYLLRGSRYCKTHKAYAIVYHDRTTIPYHTIPYHTIPYHTIPYHTIPYHTIPYHTIPYHTIPYHTIPYHTLYHTMSYHTIPYHTISYHSRPDHVMPNFWAPCLWGCLRNAATEQQSCTSKARKPRGAPVAERVSPANIGAASVNWGGSLKGSCGARLKGGGVHIRQVCLADLYTST